MFNWFVLLAAYLPFQIALNPGFGFDLASLRVFIILFFVICLWRLEVRPQLRSDLVIWGLSLFLILACFSLIGAENISWGLRKIVFFVSVFPLYLLTIILVDNWEKAKKIARVLLISSGFFALVGLIQFLAQFIFSLERVYSFWAINILPIFSGFNLGAMILAYPSWLVNVNGQTIMRSFSFFSDPHMLSFYLGMTLPLIIYLFFEKFNKILFFIYSLSFITLLLTFSRGAYLSIIITFLVLSVLLWQFLKQKKIALLFGLSLLILIIPVTPISDRFYSSFDLDEGSNVGRLDMWQQASQSGLGNFWTGVGLGNYSLKVNSALDYRNPVTAHNLYLDTFSEMGVFTLIVLLILILGTIYYLFKLVKDSGDNDKKYLAVALIGSLVYFLTHSFFETAIYQPSVLGLLMIILGLSTVTIRGRTLFCRTSAEVRQNKVRPRKGILRSDLYELYEDVTENN